MATVSTFKTTLDEFYIYLCDALNTYEEAVPVLKEELEAITTDDIYLLNENLKKQQAIFLKTKLFDQCVKEYHEKLGVKASNLSELLKELDGVEAPRFADLIRKFEKSIELITFYSNKCRTLLQTKLFNIERILELHSNTVQTTTYTKDAKEIQDSSEPKSFQTRI